LEKLREFLLASDGVNTALNDIGARDMVHLSSLGDERILLENVPAKLADENRPSVYPSVYLYCDRMDNALLEKFRRFSGPIFVVADVRVSGERFTGLESELGRYVEAVASVLGDHHGQWTENLAYSGAYQVEFEEIELGGRNFVQRALIEVELQAHE
jgi:hypothetical protein